jgi:hypothetical protein
VRDSVTDADGNTDSHSYGHCCSYSYCNCYSDRYAGCHSDTNCYGHIYASDDADAALCPDAEESSHSASATIGPKLAVISDK